MTRSTTQRGALNGMRLLRLPMVLDFTGYGRTQLFEAIKREEFPRPVRLTPGGRAIAWDEAELLAWREQRLAARSKPQQ